MAFASYLRRMLSFASSAAVCAYVSATGCIATSTIEFEPDENFPPSIISQPTAEYPLNEIGELNLDDPVDTPEAPLDVIIRDPNFDQTLEYRIFLDAPPDLPVDFDVIDPVGSLERPRTFSIPYDSLAAGLCHKVELVVVGMFASFVEPRRPVQEGDVDQATWWIRVIDADNPIAGECR